MGTRDYPGAGAVTGVVCGFGAVPAPAGPEPTSVSGTSGALDDGLATPYEARSGWTKQVAGVGRRRAPGSTPRWRTRSATRSVSGFLGGTCPTWTDPGVPGAAALGVHEHRPGDVPPARWRSSILGSAGHRGPQAGRGGGRASAVRVGGDRPHRTGPHAPGGATRVRSWYRGPLVPHPTADPPEGRLQLAHSADQVRVVVPDGREDISSRLPSRSAGCWRCPGPRWSSSLMRWRQRLPGGATGGRAGRRRARSWPSSGLPRPRHRSVTWARQPGRRAGRRDLRPARGLLR